MPAYHTIQFEYSSADDAWEFDSDGNPRCPGSRSLVQQVITLLKARKIQCTDFEQHSYYGWGFTTEYRGSKIYHVINPTPPHIALTFQIEPYVLLSLLLKRPNRLRVDYARLLKELLADIAEIRNIQ